MNLENSRAIGGNPDVRVASSQMNTHATHLRKVSSAGLHRPAEPSLVAISV